MMHQPTFWNVLKGVKEVQQSLFEWVAESCHFGQLGELLSILRSSRQPLLPQLAVKVLSFWHESISICYSRLSMLHTNWRSHSWADNTSTGGWTGLEGRGDHRLPDNLVWRARYCPLLVNTSNGTASVVKRRHVWQLYEVNAFTPIHLGRKHLFAHILYIHAVHLMLHCWLGDKTFCQVIWNGMSLQMC